MTILDLLASIEPLGVAPFFQGRGTLLLVALGTLFFACEVALFRWLWVRTARAAGEAGAIDHSVDRLEERFEGGITSKAVWEREVLPELRELPRVGAAMQAFVAHCWRTDKEICATRPATDFLDGVSEAAIDRRVLAIPSALTAVGILGTFIGITVGLQQLHRAIPEARDPLTIMKPSPPGAGSPEISDPASSPRAMDAPALAVPPALPWTELQIGMLVESLGLSFRTSIWGLLLSLLALGRLETVTGRHRRAVERLANWVDGTMPRVAHEAILVDLHDRLGDRLENALLGSGGLAQTLREGLEAAVGTQARALHSVVTEFQQGLEAHLEEWLSTVADSLERSSESARSFQEAMDTLLGRLEASARRVNELLGAAEESIERSRSGIEAAAGSLSASMHAAERVLGKLLHSFEDRDAILSRQLDALEGLRQRFEVLHGRLEGDRRTVSQLATTLESRIEALGGVLDSLVGWHEKLDEEFGRHLESWRAAIAAQSDILDGVREITKGVTEGVGGLEKLADEVGSAAERLVELVGGLDRVTRGLAEAGSTIDQAAGRLSKAHATAMRSWATVGGSLRDAAELVTKGLHTYATNVNRSLETVLRQFDEELSRSVQGIGRAINTLTDFLDALSANLETAMQKPPTEEEE